MTAKIVIETRQERLAKIEPAIQRLREMIPPLQAEIRRAKIRLLSVSEEAAEERAIKRIYRARRKLECIWWDIAPLQVERDRCKKEIEDARREIGGATWV